MLCKAGSESMVGSGIGVVLPLPTTLSELDKGFIYNTVELSYRQ